MKFSITTTIGVLASLTMVAMGVTDIVGVIDLGNYAPILERYQYLNISSLLIVLGGVLNSLFVMYPGRYVMWALGSIYHLFTRSSINLASLREDIRKILEWNKRINENKIEALNQLQEEYEGELPSYLFTLMSTNYSTEEIRRLSETAIEEHYDRGLITVEVLDSIGSSSPAFGMFGTLFGLIVMLGDLQDPAQMGPGLATALITTLYGISLAYLICFPIARKLRNLAQIKRFREYLIMEGVLMINEGDSPFFIQDKLNAYLRREYTFDQEATSSEAEAMVS
jgi:chemotaxis protein MotA